MRKIILSFAIVFVLSPTAAAENTELKKLQNELHKEAVEKPEGIHIDIIKIETTKQRGFKVKVKIINKTGQTVKSGKVSCNLLKNGQVVQVKSHYIQRHYVSKPMRNGHYYLEDYDFDGKVEFDNIGFEITEVEYQNIKEGIE
jgi:hypothetical protein